MKIVDCTWERDNLGKNVCEIAVSREDRFNGDYINSLSRGFDYIVIKVPMNQPDFYFGLAEMGFVMIETQMNISKKYLDFNFEDRLVKRLYPFVSDELITSRSELERVLGKITPNMFSTDRIYLDPYFSPDSSCKRYVNWIRSEFNNNKVDVKKYIYDGKEIGFGMGKIVDGISHGLLGGVYENYQSEGYGFLTACFSFIMAKKNSEPFRKVVTSISTNNIPMVQIYNYLQFKLDSMTYVFVKHQK